MGCSKSNSKREVYSNSISPQETRKISNNVTLYLKQLEKEEPKKPKVHRQKEIIKIRADGTSLVIQCLRLRAPNVGGPGSVPGWGTKIPHMATKHTCCNEEPAQPKERKKVRKERRKER